MFLGLSALLGFVAVVNADLRSSLTGQGFTVSFPGDFQYVTLSQACEYSCSSTRFFSLRLTSTIVNRRYTFQPAAIALPSTPQHVSTILLASAANNVQVVGRSGGVSTTRLLLGVDMTYLLTAQLHRKWTWRTG